MKIKNNHNKGFSLIEILVSLGLFLLLSGSGIGAYYKYYTVSLINYEINNVRTLINETRFKALKNPTGSDYGIHIDTANSKLIRFKDAYVPAGPNDKEVELNKTAITNISLLPDIGVTNEIIFEGKTGKTENSGSFTIGEGAQSYTFNLNPQGVIN